MDVQLSILAPVHRYEFFISSMPNITGLLKDELSTDDGRVAKELAHALIEKAKGGNASIAKLIFDRIDGPIAKDEKEPLSEEERVERITIILDRARDRRTRQRGKRNSSRN